MRRYISVNQMLIPALINFVLNGLISWLILHKSAEVTVWGEPAIGPDLLLTSFLIAFISCLVNSYAIPKQLKSRKQLKLRNLPASGLHNRSIIFRSLFLSTTTVIFFGIPTVLLIEFYSGASIHLYSFVIFKATWSAILAAIVCPFIALWAIRGMGSAQVDNT